LVSSVITPELVSFSSFWSRGGHSGSSSSTISASNDFHENNTILVSAKILRESITHDAGQEPVDIIDTDGSGKAEKTEESGFMFFSGSKKVMLNEPALDMQYYETSA